MTKKTTHTPKGSETDARDYIDNIVAISRRHGMTTNVPASTYESAVTRTTRVFRGLNEAASRKKSAG